MYKGDPIPCIPPPVMAWQIGGLLACVNYTRKIINPQNKWVLRSLSLCVVQVSGVFVLMLKPVHTPLTNHNELNHRKKNPIGAPCWDKDGTGSWISVLYL